MLTRICYEWSLALSLLPIRGIYDMKLRINVFFVTILYSGFLHQGLAIFLLELDTSCTNYSIMRRFDAALSFVGSHNLMTLKLT